MLWFFGVGGLASNGVGESTAGKEEGDSDDVAELHLDGVDGLKIEDVEWI